MNYVFYNFDKCNSRLEDCLYHCRSAARHTCILHSHTQKIPAHRALIETSPWRLCLEQSGCHSFLSGSSRCLATVGGNAAAAAAILSYWGQQLWTLSRLVAANWSFQVFYRPLNLASIMQSTTFQRCCCECGRFNCCEFVWYSMCLFHIVWSLSVVRWISGWHVFNNSRWVFQLY